MSFSKVKLFVLVGALRIEVQTWERQPVDGFGEEIERVVRRRGGDIGALESQLIRLRMVATKEVDLYSLGFRRPLQARPRLRTAAPTAPGPP